MGVDLQKEKIILETNCMGPVELIRQAWDPNHKLAQLTRLCQQMLERNPYSKVRHVSREANVADHLVKLSL